MNDRAMSAMANELRQLIDKANAPIFGIDVEGNVNEWNEKTAEITGYSRQEADKQPLGMLPTDFVDMLHIVFFNHSFLTFTLTVKTFIVSSLQSSVQEVLDNALRGTETSNYGLEFRTKTNEIRYLLVNATTRRNAENNIVGVVGYVLA
jgi:PAS domain-containing protein